MAYSIYYPEKYLVTWASVETINIYDRVQAMSQSLFESKGLLIPKILTQSFVQFRYVIQNKPATIVVYCQKHTVAIQHTIKLYQPHDFFSQDFLLIIEATIQYDIGLHE
jgi:hypothetical protein